LVEKFGIVDDLLSKNAMIPQGMISGHDLWELCLSTPSGNSA